MTGVPTTPSPGSFYLHPIFRSPTNLTCHPELRAVGPHRAPGSPANLFAGVEDGAGAARDLRLLFCLHRRQKLP